MKNMRQVPLNKEVLRLAVPSLLANITIPLVGIVDTAIAGHISDASAIGGIAIGTMLFDLLYWNFGFLRVGTAGMTAQAWGKEPHSNSAHNVTHSVGAGTNAILIQSLTTALVASLLIWLLQYPFIVISLRLIPCSPEVAAFAREYFFIRIWAAPATLSLMALRGWFIGMQNTIATMIVDLVVNSVNMLASWLLAVHTPLGAMGVAWGTLIAQYSGMAVAAGILLTRYAVSGSLAETRSALQWQRMKRLMVLNKDLFIRSICFMVVYVGFTSLSARYGDTELAVSSIIMKLFMLFSYFIDGFAYAGEALTGRYIGAREDDNVRRVVGVLLIWTLSIGIVCSLLYGITGTSMIGVMTNDKNIIAASKPYLIWLWLMPVASSAAFLWDGIYIGATAGKELRNCMIWSAVGFALTYALLERPFGMQALYGAYFVHLAVRTLYLSLLWKDTKEKSFGVL